MKGQAKVLKKYVVKAKGRLVKNNITSSPKMTAKKKMTGMKKKAAPKFKTNR